MKKLISPEKVMRGGTLCCLVATGVAMIYRAKHPGYLTPYGSQLFDTTTFCFLNFLLFLIFYGQYVWIPRILKRPLNPPLGFVQTFLCLALVLFGLLPLWMPDLGVSSAFKADSMVLTIAILGEALFAVNVCWTLLKPAPLVYPIPVAAVKPAGPPLLQAELHPVLPLQAGKKRAIDWTKWKNPQSPVEMFGVTAIFLFLGGLLMFAFMSDSRFLVQLGERKLFWPMGLLWWLGAVPFAGFSFAYWIHAGLRSVPYDKLLTKTHLVVTLVWLIDFVRLMMHAQWAIMSTLPDLMKDNYLFELYVLFGAAIAMFFVNISRQARTTAK